MVFLTSYPSRSYHSVLPGTIPSACAAATAVDASAVPCLNAFV